MKKLLTRATGAVAALGLAFAVAAYTPDYFEISKQLDIFSNVFKEVNLYYVDDTQPGELMSEAIESMLSSLDPYTNYIPEERVEDFKIQTTGHYGGIGASIRQKDKHMIITSVYEGFAADKAGIRPGDRLLMVGGKDIAGMSTDEVSNILKGSPGSEVILTLERQGEPLNLTVTREDVEMKSVPYYGMLPGNIAYIALTSFTQNASKDVKNALNELKKEHEVDAIVLDLRSNPGGLLSEAVNVSNLFIEKGKIVVDTKGKMEEWEKTYKTLNRPEDLETPLAVLINSGSASASEIVAGTLQDYDRAVVIGQRSFGKGLVQQTRKLSYGAQLKVTIAKYYTASGRGIQAINYAERDEDGSVSKIPDSLRNRFTTENGRAVYDGGGIDPDIEVDQPRMSDMMVELFRRMLVFDYATRYQYEKAEIAAAEEFMLSEGEFEQFLTWLKEQDFSFETRTEKHLKQLEANARKEGYLPKLEDELTRLREKYDNLEAMEIGTYRQEIKHMLEEEIASRYYYSHGRIANSLSHDREVARAREILSDMTTYREILGFEEAE